MTISAAFGVLAFNGGLQEHWRVQHSFGVKVGMSALGHAEKKDSKRIKISMKNH